MANRYRLNGTVTADVYVEVIADSMEEAIEYARKLIIDGTKVSDACKEAAKKFGFTKSEIYSGVISENRK